MLRIFYVAVVLSTSSGDAFSIVPLVYSSVSVNWGVYAVHQFYSGAMCYANMVLALLHTSYRRYPVQIQLPQLRYIPVCWSRVPLQHRRQQIPANLP